MRLPAALADLSGLRAARWVRESTPGQFDRYGPEAQAGMQDAAIKRFGLVDTGLSWSAAQSGRTVYRSGLMAEMLAAASRREFDLLLVGYVSRWQRNLRRTLELLEDALHPVGVAVYFCDEEILSSCDRHWDQLVDEAKDAERYSRRLARRIREGYASKRASQRDPGGHPPFGFVRNADKLLETDTALIPTVERMYRDSAAGFTDREVARDTGVPLFTVRGVLTSPLYAGRLRDGSAGHWRPMVSGALWAKVQEIRARRATTTGRPADPRRPYSLDMLHCAGCGKRLTGDTGYYRHREPCSAFLSAMPPERPTRGRTHGHAYRMDLYEAIVAGLLEHAALSAGELSTVVGALDGPRRDDCAQELRQIERERDAAMAQYRRDRDASLLDQTMRALDAREAVAGSGDAEESIRPADAVRFLQDLPTTWEAAAGGQGRRLLARALFDRIDVLGIREAVVHLSDHAVRHGMAAVLPAQLGISVNGRGERI